MPWRDDYSRLVLVDWSEARLRCCYDSLRSPHSDRFLHLSLYHHLSLTLCFSHLCSSVLPPVLVPRNPNPISRTYEPVPSYMEPGRATTQYANNDIFPMDTPGTAPVIGW